MKRIIEKFNRLTVSKKIQLIAAVVFTVGLVAAVSVYHAPLKQMTV